MNDRRNYEKNGIGWHQEYRRRDYDKTAIDSFCLHCDLRQEVKEKLSIKIFAIFISSVISLIAIAATLSGIGFTRILDNQKNTLSAIHSVGERTAKIEARQEILMRRVIDIDNSTK